MSAPVDIEASRFWPRVTKTEGCWLWTGKLSSSGGYGIYCQRGLELTAHRVAYELVVGPIPPSLKLDHLCHNEAAARGECDGGNCIHRRCVNPAHLEPVTQSVNALSSPLNRCAINAAKSHCDYGHEFTPENTYLRPGRIGRTCRTCIRRWARLAKRRLKAARTADGPGHTNQLKEAEL